MPTYPNNAEAAGIWSLKDQFIARMGNNWPGAITVTEVFTASGTWICPTGVDAVDYLVVGGGGSGGSAHGGGGGAGGLS